MNWTEAGIILALVLLNGFFAGSELALVSARKARLRTRAERGHRGARVALELLANPTRLLFRGPRDSGGHLESDRG